MNPILAVQMMLTGGSAENLEKLSAALNTFALPILDISQQTNVNLLPANLRRSGAQRIYWYHAPIEYFFGIAESESLNLARDAALDDHPEWKVETVNNSWAKMADYGGGTYSMLLDITAASYRAWLVNAYVDSFEAAGLAKRIFVDRMESGISYLSGLHGNAALDLDNDGIADNAATMNQAWRDGWVEFLDDLTAAGFDIMANGGWNTHDDYIGHADHLYIEGFDLDPLTSGYTAASHSVPAQLRSVSYYGRDSVLLVRQNHDPTDADWQRRHRFTVCAALCLHPDGEPTRAVASFSSNTSLPAVGYRTIQMGDYSAVNRVNRMTTTSRDGIGYLGNATGRCTSLADETDLVTLLRSSEYQDVDTQGWKREFRGGVVLWNPTDSPIAVVNSWQMRHVRGMLDETLNGSRPTTVTVPARDGVILIR